jgi:hypothetical protein
MRWPTVCTLLLFSLILPPLVLSQQTDSTANSSSAVCTFADEKQMSVRYNPVKVGKDEAPNGKIWVPGNFPMDLFTETTLTLNNTDIPTGAYRLYFLPGKETWTMIVSKNVSPNAAYDEKDDLVRAPMQSGKLPQPEAQVSVYFGHIAPKTCDMRLDVGKIRVWIDFGEK